MRSRTPNAITVKKKNIIIIIKKKNIYIYIYTYETLSYSYDRPRYGRSRNRGAADTPDQIIIVHAWLVMDDLNNIVLKEKAVAQGWENSFLLLEEPLQNINQPLDR